MSGYDPETELFGPLQKLLDQCKGAKVLSRYIHIHIYDSYSHTIITRKLAKRIEDLTQDSSALKAHLLPQLKTLNNLVPDIVDFGISVRFPGLCQTPLILNCSACNSSRNKSCPT